MKRIVLFLNGSKEDGRVVAVTHSASLNDLLLSASSKLGVNATKLFTRHGGLIDDVHLIRDDDVLYVSEGESFISFEEKTQSNEAKQSNLSSTAANARKSGAGSSVVVGADCVSTGDRGANRRDLANGASSENAAAAASAADNHDANICQLSSAFQTLGSCSETLPGDWITINVGGKSFTTTRSTLTNKEPSSMLARMFASGENRKSEFSFRFIRPLKKKPDKH